MYLSEWHPIIRYGVRHDWNTIKKYPCVLDDSDAWGNLIAFKNDPGHVVINKFIKKIASFEKIQEEKISIPRLSRVVNLNRIYTAFAIQVRSKSPTLFTIAQFILSIFRFARSNLGPSVLVLFSLTTLAFLPILSRGLWPLASIFWGTAGFLLVCIVAAFGVAFAKNKIISLVNRSAIS